MRLRAAVFVLGLAGVLLLASGCIGGDGGGPDTAPDQATAAAPSPSGPTAKDQLVEALQRSHAVPFRFAVSSDLPETEKVSASGAFDVARKLYQATTTVTGGKSPGTGHRIVVKTDTYLRENKDKRWVHLDLSRIETTNTLLYFDMADPTGLVRFTSAVQTAEHPDPHTFTGDFDPTATMPGFLPIGAPSLVSIGMRMSPYTATVDDQGWVTSIHIELTPSHGPKIVMTTTFREHGKALPIKAPAKSTVDEADPFYYK